MFTVAVALLGWAMASGINGDSTEQPTAEGRTYPTRNSSEGSTALTRTTPLDITTGMQTVDVANDLSSVCDKLANTFNNINNVLPMSVEFKQGEYFGIIYPPGKINLFSGAKRMGRCVSYPLVGVESLMVHLELTEQMEIAFPQYMINNQSWRLSLQISQCEVVLHYQITIEKNYMEMKVVMAEVKNLGVVSIHTDYKPLDGRDFTTEAEDIIRPALLQAVNIFAKDQFHWRIAVVRPDTSLDGFESFKLIFKRTMIQIGKTYEQLRNKTV